MPLTAQQIDILFEFIRKKFVPYYDLQVELVDHLASSIEEEMAQHTTVIFEQALQKVYARFGIFGFAHVVQEKEIALEKNNRRLRLKAVKKYFTLPKVSFTVLLFLSAYLISPLLQPTFRAWVIYLFVSVYAVTECIILYQSQKACIKKLLLTKYANIFSGAGLMVPYIVCVSAKSFVVSHALFALLFTISFIVQTAFSQINRQVRQNAMHLYPEAFATV